MNPKITVIIPTYNYEQYISFAIESILQQDYPQDSIEIIVVDDGSTDNTAEVLKKYIQSKVIKYFYRQNHGKANATKFAIEQCTGKYIFNLDADDYFLPSKISASVDIFENDSTIVHVASPAKIAYESRRPQHFEIEEIPLRFMGKGMNGRQMLVDFYRNNILYGGGTTFSARATTLKSIIIPDEVDMHIDEFLILTVLNLGNSYFINAPLSVWRVHDANYSGHASPQGKKMEKAHRLLISSSVILKYLEKNSFPDQLIDVFRLRDATTQIVYKELDNSKNIRDIFRYASFVFIKIRPSFSIIKKYSVLNRLLPLSIYRFLKKRRTQLGTKAVSIEPNVLSA